MDRRSLLRRLFLGTAAAAATSVIPPKPETRIETREYGDWFLEPQAPLCKACGFVSMISAYSDEGYIGKLWITEVHRSDCPRYNLYPQKRVWQGN